MKTLKAIEKATSVLVVMLMYDLGFAMAASGGRMGGSSFSSRSSNSLRSHSAPTYSSPSYASSSYRARRYASGWEYCACVGHNVGSGSHYVSPAVGSGSHYVGPAVGSESDSCGIMLVLAVVLLTFMSLRRALENSKIMEQKRVSKMSMLKLQVGLLDLGRSVQKDLNHIAEIADTSTSEGRRYVLSETILSMLRHSDYCISAYSSVDVKKSIDKVEESFNELSMEERRKFDEETLVNVNNIKDQRSTIPSSSGCSSEYIVITILVAAEGEHKLSRINSSEDLEEALQKLASIPSSTMLAVEVLWTPQKEDDTLSERELLEDYPLLRPLKEVQSVMRLPFSIIHKLVN